MTALADLSKYNPRHQTALGQRADLDAGRVSGTIPASPWSAARPLDKTGGKIQMAAGGIGGRLTRTMRDDTR